MNRFISIFFSILLFSCVGNNDLLNTTKVRYFGGILKQKAVDILVYQNRKYILGSSNSFSSNSDDIYLICTDQIGNELFSRTYGEKNINETAVGFVLLNDGLLIAYNTSITEGEQDIYSLLNINFDGDIIQQGNVVEQNYLANSILKLNENEFIVNGIYTTQTQSSYFVSKITKTGERLWRTDGTAKIANSNIVKGHFVPGQNITLLFGDTSIKEANQNNQQVHVIIIDNNNGSILNSKTFGGLGNDIFYDYTYENGKYYVVGSSTSDLVKGEVKANKDFLFFSFSVNSNNIISDFENEITFGGDGNDIGKSLVIDNNNDVIIYGNTQSFRQGISNFDQIIIKMSEKGQVYQEWLENPRLIGADRNDVAVKVIKDNQTGIFFLGEVTYTTTDDNILISLLKTNLVGKIQF